MAPSMLIDAPNDFTMPTKLVPHQMNRRTLLLSPPSLSSHEERLTEILQMYNRSQTDLHMLDRLAMGLVSLPGPIYDAVVILADADGSRRESQSLISRSMLAVIIKSMKPGAELYSQDQTLGQDEGLERNEAILTGFNYIPGREFIKPEDQTQEPVPLCLGKKKGTLQATRGTEYGGAVSITYPLTAERKLPTNVSVLPAGVGFYDSTVNDDSDDDIIDEDELMADEELIRSVNVPTACKPRAKRRACKDCTCGLATRLNAEDNAKRAAADRQLSTMKLQLDDLAEVDFTVQGKVGSCGSCSLGDAFRCDGCPYIGLPAFKPGEEVTILENEVQL